MSDKENCSQSKLTRRQFLKGLGVGGGLAIGSALAGEFVVNMFKPTSVGAENVESANRHILPLDALNLTLYKPFEWPPETDVIPTLWKGYKAEKIYWSKWDRAAYQDGNVPIQQRLLQGEGQLHGPGVYDIEIPNANVKFVDIGVQVKNGNFTFRTYEPIYGGGYTSGIINAGPKRWMPKPGAITSILAVNSSHPDDRVTSQASIDSQIHAWNRIKFEDRDMVLITHALPYQNNGKNYLRMLEVTAWLLENP